MMDMSALAPELLSALKECALQIAQNHGRKLTYDEVNALAWARDVIAKAEGSACGAIAKDLQP